MADLIVSKFEHDGLELYVDETTGLAYAHRAAIKRMLGIENSGETLSRRLEAVSKDQVKTAEIETTKGMKVVSIYPADVVFDLAFEFCPPLAKRMGAAGANVFMLGLAGYRTEVKPKTALELAKEQVKLHEAIEFQKVQIAMLQEATERQAEVIDELFDYSSIIRIAKYNGCGEDAFKWHVLKAASKTLNLEIKKAPCQRYGEKNLYSHDAWRLAYPGYRLPETTTLVINSHAWEG
jgi:hypothetical protein